MHLDRVALRAAQRARADVLIDAGALEAMFTIGLCAAARRDAAVDDTLDAGLLACESAIGSRWLPVQVVRSRRRATLVVSAPLPEPLMSARRKNIWFGRHKSDPYLFLCGFFCVGVLQGFHGGVAGVG